MLTAYRFTTGIYAPDGKLIRAVKNLGWLRSHWKDVAAFEMRDDHVLMAYLRNGNIYAIKWADPTVAREWLSRPVFRGVPVKWFGVDTVAGEIKWRAEYERGGKRRRGGKGRGWSFSTRDLKRAAQQFSYDEFMAMMEKLPDEAAYMRGKSGTVGHFWIVNQKGYKKPRVGGKRRGGKLRSSSAGLIAAATALRDALRK